MIRANVFGNAVYRVEISLPEFMCAVATLATCMAAEHHSLVVVHRLGVVGEDSEQGAEDGEEGEREREDDGDGEDVGEEDGEATKEPQHEKPAHKGTMQLFGLMQELEPTVGLGGGQGGVVRVRVCVCVCVCVWGGGVQ